MPRRMFSPEVIDTDNFLEMGATARLLYYDLGMRADNDGFVTPLKVIRLTGASPDDLKVLIAKGYIYIFEDGIIVIKHWLINNNIPNDKYMPSIYNNRLQKLINDGSYSKKLSTGRPKSGLELVKDTEKGTFKDTEKGSQVRLGKVRLGKNNIYSEKKVKETYKFKDYVESHLEEFALKHPEIDVPREWEQCKDYHAGVGKIPKDWSATFRRWLNSPYEKIKSSKPLARET